MKAIKFKGYIIIPSSIAGYDVYNKSGEKMNFFLPILISKTLDEVKFAIKKHLIY